MQYSSVHMEPFANKGSIGITFEWQRGTEVYEKVRDIVETTDRPCEPGLKSIAESEAQRKLKNHISGPRQEAEGAF
jgi:hypothetical protein